MKRFYSEIRPSSRTSKLSSLSVWNELTPLSIKYKSVNLGQGFPDFFPEKFVIDATQKALQNNLVQYTRSQGHLRLCNALANTYNPLINRELDPMQNFVITDGATEAIFLSFLTFCDVGDEVILFEPFYDSYPTCIHLSGGVPIYVPFVPSDPNDSSSDWKFDRQMFENSISSKTKIIILSNPSVAIGKVFTHDDLKFISELAIKHDLLVISDEVYEWMVYDGKSHTKMASLPGMFERTLTLGSAGKTFSVTGFKIGWIIGPGNLMERIQAVHTTNVFSVATPLQEGIAESFEIALTTDYFSKLTSSFQSKRDLLSNILNDCNLKPIIPEGSYFITAHTDSIPDDKFMDPKSNDTRDYQISRWLTKEIGVTVIPPSAFYSDEHKHMARNYVRFAFCKKDETLVEASKRLKKLNHL